MFENGIFLEIIWKLGLTIPIAFLAFALYSAVLRCFLQGVYNFKVFGGKCQVHIQL